MPHAGWLPGGKLLKGIGTCRPDIDVDDIARTLAVSVIVNGQNLTWDFTQIGTILATIVILGER